MEVNNNARLIRREILARISRILLNDNDLSMTDRIALEMRPKKGGHVRCCLYRDRAIIKYKIMAMVGFQENQEVDELKDLKSYFAMAFAGETKNAPLLGVVDEACSSCRKTNYVVTNMCQACVGRPCMLNCPKKAIDITDGQAKISQQDCVNCGMCLKVCPFHAIIYTPVPCEEVCPVSAIKKDEYGKEKIDLDRCILCGKCLEACPFGAIVERTQLFDVIREIEDGKQVVAMLAPAVAGQFRNSMQQIMSGFKAIGFFDVAEVASGADVTSVNEAKEFMEKIRDGQSMTTSCCPSYVNLISKHSPELMKYVSGTLSPMEYTAKALRKKYPDAILVFVGPCVAKKGEAMKSENVDYVINIEEYGAWLVASGTELSACSGTSPDESISQSARNYAVAGGVSSAVAMHLPYRNFETIRFEGIDKSFLRKLKPVLQKNSSVLVEVMSCENGCIGGCNVIANPRSAAGQLKSFINNMENADNLIVSGH
jgi:[FeFe] hydrogenase (group B1/B3)